MGFTVSNNLSIRQYYNDDKALIHKDKRAEVTKGKLASTDALALRRAVRKLEKYNFGDSTDDLLYEKMKAFADTYNYTIESNSKYASSDRGVKRALQEMKSLSQTYASELKGYGITFDDDGYMSVTTSSVQNLDHNLYESMFGQDSEYMKGLSKYTSRLNKHIDIYL